MAGMFAQFPIERITSILTLNESYNSPYFILTRFCETYDYHQKWFGEGIEDKLSQSAQDVLKIRKIHELFAKKLGEMAAPPPKKPKMSKKKRAELLDAIRKDLAHIPVPDYLAEIMTPSPKVPISQFDMVMIHGTFFFVFDINPSAVGLHTHTDEGYEDYVYYIGIIGRLLGIEDRFNLPLLPSPALRKAVSRRLWAEIVIPCFKLFSDSNFDRFCYFMEIYGPGAVEMILNAIVGDALGIQGAEQLQLEGQLNWFAHRMALVAGRRGTALMKYGPFRVLANTGVKAVHRGAVAAIRALGLRNPAIATPDAKMAADI